MIVNSPIVLSGSDRHFLMGLGVTEVLYLAGRRLGGEGSGVALVLSLGIAGSSGCSATLLTSCN